MTRRVLVVDDAEDIRAVARMSLERLAGWVVTEAANGEEAVRLASADRPDAVLLDLHMPGLDGEQTVALLQADPRTSDIPVLLLTARTDSTTDPAPGVRGVVPKPFDPVRLADEISTALGWTP
jgi:CheY-like chemotaxis protein